MSSRARWLWALAALILLALLRVGATHRVFSATADEPAHVASGYDFVTSGRYVLDPTHPPLARVLFGLALRANGVISRASDAATLQPIWASLGRGTELLWANGAYLRNLSGARRANLLFLLGALIVVAVWTWQSLGPAAALIAVALYGSLPPILGHAGVATTDMAAAATLPLALLALQRWLVRPTILRAALLGLAIGAGLASKMSFVLFFAVAGAIVLWRNRRGVAIRRTALTAMLAAILAAVSLWASYGFHVGTMASYSPVMPQVLRDLAGERAAALASNVPLPAPEFFVGIAFVKVHNERGHSAFLLGERRDHGWRHYFLVALLVKTPLPFLLLFVIGTLHAIRARNAAALQHALICAALLLAVMPSSINIGIRHILGIYASMAVVAAYGAIALWSSRNRAARGALAALLLWHAVSTTLAHPDYLAWFNELAGRHPERILGDSNLDWGQDVLRLAEAAREEKIDRLSLLIFGSNDLDRVGLPPHQQLTPDIPVQGWIAVSETALQLEGASRFAWLERHRPVRRIGKSIRLYYIR